MVVQPQPLVALGVGPAAICHYDVNGARHTLDSSAGLQGGEEEGQAGQTGMHFVTLGKPKTHVMFNHCFLC